MEIPKKLYKYVPFDEYSIKNLKKQSLYFASPSGFNDPYDCAFDVQLENITIDQINGFKEIFIKNSTNPELAQQYFEQNKDEFIEEKLKHTIKDEIVKARDHYYTQIGITCFSESNSDLLMWSHYGGRYRGFCLEFDSTYAPFTKARKVIYSDIMPKFNPMRFLDDDLESQFMDLFCIKSKSWEYEKEWRVFHLESGTPFIYEEKALTGIYFGPDMENEFFEIIALILRGQNRYVKLYRGKRSTTIFKVEFEEITYTPYLESKERGLR